MAKKILIVPDVHGRTFWKEPIYKLIDEVDKVIFLGDYLDPYEEESGLSDDIFVNMMEIIELKRNNAEKFVLLKGNHDQHYASERFEELAGGTRMDLKNWNKFHQAFNDYKDLFQIAHLELINEVPYVFSHAGLTLYWLKKVNENVWKLSDNHISVTDPSIIERINQLDDEGKGQDMLAIVGSYRSWFGEKTGSVLWADIEEHGIPNAPKAYGLNKVFQVFGHTKLNDGYDKIVFDNFAMIDSRQCFIIDESIKEKIINVTDYEKETII
jgi:hypothetical protein